MVKEKIFGIGLSRTGTTSLTAAMKVLGFRSLHYPNYRLKNFTSITIDKEELEKNEFLSDVPVAFLFKELDQKYPDAKFILTIRDEESWLKSVSVFFTRENGTISKGHLIDFLRFINPKNSFFRGLYCLRYFVYGSFKFKSSKYLKGYRKHNNDVIKYFEDKPEKLLVVNLINEKNKWEKLCSFLGREIPKEAFPHANNAKLDQKKTKND